MASWYIMRILWLSHFYPYPPAGGALQRSFHLTREISKRHELHLVSLSNYDGHPPPEAVDVDYESPREYCSKVRIFPIPAEESYLRKFWVIASGLWGDAPYDDRWLSSNELGSFIRHRLNLSHIDLVHIDTIGLARYSEWLTDVPCVMNHHNIESHMMARRSEKEKSLPKRWYMAREARKLACWERRWCREFEQNLVVSDLDGERLQRTVPDVAWATVPNGVDTEYFSPAPVRDTDREGLVFVGRMSWYPNHDAVEWLLAEIWPAIRRALPDITLTLVGSSPPSKAKQLLSSGVRATGFVPDVRPYMNNARIYICPIRTGGGTRLKVLDAMAMGMPLVATGMSVEGLGVEAGSHFLRADTTDEFVEAVAVLDKDRELRAEISRRARATAVKRFSWSKIADRLDGVYEEAARK